MAQEVKGINTSNGVVVFDSGYQRGASDNKIKYHLIRNGPMFKRWAIHMTKGALFYGENNWTNAETPKEMDRFLESAMRHFEQWLDGEQDEDHAAAIFFNINGAEYVRERLHGKNNLFVL